ncbi:hypothetical protein UF64_09595 [Thalassospira sp. HJ]|nr:hypothetical protein UF64_09595 [Thalassospira sp. HJ]
MDLRWIEDFIALADTLNFSRAAELRNITQPAFSRRIRSLESWMNAPLVARTTHSVELTAAGRSFKPHAIAIAHTIHQAKREAIALNKAESTSLTFAATHALSFTFMPEWLRVTNENLCLGTLSLVSDSMQACETLMEQDQVDFLVTHAHPQTPSQLSRPHFISRVIGHDRLISVVGPAPKNDSTARTKPFPYLAYSDASGLGRIISATAATLTCPAIAGKPVFTSHLAATLLSMVKNGAGAAWLPESLAQRDLTTGQIEVLSADLAIPVEIRIYRPVRRLNRAAEELWASLPTQ